MGKNFKVTKTYEQRKTDEEYAKTLEEAKARARNWVRMFEAPTWIDKTEDWVPEDRRPKHLVLEGYEDELDTKIEIKRI